MRSVGEAAALNLGQHKHLDAAQGVKGSALADLLESFLLWRKLLVGSSTLQ